MRLYIPKFPTCKHFSAATTYKHESPPRHEKPNHSFMSQHETPIDALDGQLETVQLIRWLLEPTTAKATQPETPMEGPSGKQNGSTEMVIKSVEEVTVGSEAVEATAAKPVKIISCIQCQSRKIKCDKVKPACSPCVKSKAGICEYRPPAPPRRGKRKPTEADLLSRLQRYENLLRGSGYEIDKDENNDKVTQVSTSNGIVERPSKKRQTSQKHTNDTKATAAGLSTRSDGPSTGEIIVGEEGSRYVESDLWRSIGAVVYPSS